MKFAVARYWLCLMVQNVALAALTFWRGKLYGDNPIGVLLAWPATGLARLGWSPTWPVVILLLLALPAAPVLLLRKRSIFLQVGMISVLALAYCGIGHWHARWTVDNIKPVNNPYLAGSTNAAAYAEGYVEGFLYGRSGSWVTHCFAPEDETQGFEQGLEDGGAIWNRAFPILVRSSVGGKTNHTHPTEPARK